MGFDAPAAAPEDADAFSAALVSEVCPACAASAGALFFLMIFFFCGVAAAPTRANFPLAFGAGTARRCEDVDPVAGLSALALPGISADRSSSVIESRARPLDLGAGGTGPRVSGSSRSGSRLFEAGTFGSRFVDGRVVIRLTDGIISRRSRSQSPRREQTKECRRVAPCRLLVPYICRKRRDARGLGPHGRGSL
ncbi:MAG: hypothetical protein KF764_22095 [Labilithrix sp.]|nr:hypothetical protein [Labilithrix sp.]